MKIHPVRAELFNEDTWMDRRTDIHGEANSHFRIYANILENALNKRGALAI